MNIVHHYPPDLLQLLIDTIPRLVRSKRDVFLFFKGAGVDKKFTVDLERRLSRHHETIGKFEIARMVLDRLNDAGERTLRERREVLKRVVEFEDFSTCWENEKLVAQGLVSKIQKLVEVKDSFTRMRLEREAEVRKHREIKDKEIEAKRLRGEALEGIHQDLTRLFALQEPQERGRKLEGVLNRLFELEGILVREAFTRVDEPGEGIIEQIDGVVEIDAHLYIVEMKWLNSSVGIRDVSQHLVRVFNRGGSRGIFISYSNYTAAAMQTCRESLGKAVIVLCQLQELVVLMENGSSLREMLSKKINGAILDKQPFTRVI